MADLTQRCEHEELLSAFLDGELLPGELAVVSHHLSSCPACIAVFRELRTIRSTLRTLPEVEPPPLLVPGGHLGSAMSAYLDGELPTQEVADLSRHLAGCVECRRELQELDSARIAIRALPRLEPPPLIALASAPARRARWRAVAIVAAGAAAVAALTLGIDRSGADESVDLESLASRHAARVSVDAGFAVAPAGVPQGGR